MLIHFVSNCVVLIVLLATGTDLGWSSVLIIWTNMVIYGLVRWRERVFYLAFLGAFFVFLIGRETLVRVFGYPEPGLSPDAAAHLSLVLVSGLSAIFISYLLADWRRNSSAHLSAATAREINEVGSLTRRRAFEGSSLLLFWGTLPAALFKQIERIIRVLQGGYVELYTEEFRSSSVSGFSAVVHQLSLVNEVAFVAFLATMPRFRTAAWPAFAWLGCLGLSLGSGQRAAFLLGVLFIFCYSVTRNYLTPSEPWITGRGYVVAASSVPFLLLLMVGVEVARGVGGEYSRYPINTLVEFFYNQGVSATVIANGYTYQSLIPDQTYLLEFTHSGLLARLLGIPVLQGNSLAHALSGGSYTHSLAYVVLGENLYFSGRGTGSSFLAEAYQDGGYLGVVLVGVIFGLLIHWSGRLHRGQVIGNVFRLLVIQSLLWAPRGSATGFLTKLQAPSTLGALAAIYLLTLVVERRIINASAARSGGRSHRSPPRRGARHSRRNQLQTNLVPR